MKTGNKQFVCPVCDYIECEIIAPYLAITDSFKDAKIVKCLSCNTVSMHPRNHEFSSEEYYEKQYWTDERFARRSPSLKAQACARCLFMRPEVSYNDTLRVLDVGAGVGYMNWGFRTIWPNVQTDYTAIEVNPAAVKFLRKDPGVDNIFKNLDELQGAFDVIVLSHILEHVTEPVDFLNKLKKYYSNPGGYLFVEVPNMDFRFKRRNEPHVVFYSIESLSEVLTRQGFKVLKIASCGHHIWKIRADGGMDNHSKFLSLRQFLYNLMVRKHNVFNNYGGDRQWIRAICRIDMN